MMDDTIQRVLVPAEEPNPTGRKADLLAAILGAFGMILSLSAAIWFFLGFVENDKRPEHLSSAFLLTLLLFSLAAGPFGIVAEFGRRAFKSGARKSYLLWTLILMGPWIVLGTIAVTHTPLPLWCGLLIAGLAGILCLWALISLILDRGNQHLLTDLDTDLSGEIEMPNPE